MNEDNWPEKWINWETKMLFWLPLDERRGETWRQCEMNLMFLVPKLGKRGMWGSHHGCPVLQPNTKILGQWGRVGCKGCLNVGRLSVLHSLSYFQWTQNSQRSQLGCANTMIGLSITSATLKIRSKFALTVFTQLTSFQNYLNEKNKWRNMNMYDRRYLE